jgi:hypothetical protein
MRRFNYVPVMCIAMIGMAASAMDSREGRPSFVGIKKRHPVTPTVNTQEPQAPDGIPVDQADLQRKLLDNTDYLLSWTGAQKVTLGTGVVVIAVVLAGGGYLLYEKFYPVKQDDGQQDQQPTEQAKADGG